jgi:hypothetical protein
LKLSLVDTATGVMTIGTGTVGQDSATAVMVLLPPNQISAPTVGVNGYLGGSTVAMTGDTPSNATLTITFSTSLATSIDPARVGRVALETT